MKLLQMALIKKEKKKGLRPLRLFRVLKTLSSNIPVSRSEETRGRNMVAFCGIFISTFSWLISEVLAGIEKLRFFSNVLSW